jgi:hypothetical protein
MNLRTSENFTIDFIELFLNLNSLNDFIYNRRGVKVNIIDMVLLPNDEILFNTVSANTGIEMMRFSITELMKYYE